MAIAIALGTVLATFLGGMLALKSHQRLHLVLGLSAGLLLGLVAFDLIPEVFELNTSEVAHVPLVMVLFVAGFMLLHILERFSGAHEPIDSAPDHIHTHAHSTTGILGALGMVVHVFLDGVAVALAFSVSTGTGIAVSVAVVAHAFSDGLNTVSMLIHHGKWESRAKWLLGADGVARVAGAALGSVLTISEPVLGMYLAVFAGFVVYLATAHILPEAHSRHSSKATLLTTIAGVVAMLAIVSLTHGAH